MPRKKLDDERIPQIVEAFEHCLVQYGLAETTLEMVAKEAGVSRTTIHHYIGGRDELIKVTCQQFIEGWLEGISHSAEADINELTDLMYPGWVQETGDGAIIMNELNSYLSTDSGFKTAAELYDFMFESVAVRLQRFYPDASLEDCKVASQVLYGLGFGLSHLGQHGGLPSEDVQRASMKGILDKLLL